MRQLIESIVVFNFVTSRFVPIRKSPSKVMQIAVYAAIFVAFFTYQVYEFTSSKYKSFCTDIVLLLL